MLVARVALLALLVGCPSSTTTTTTPKQTDDINARVEIARLEARRADGIPVLVELAKSLAKHHRVLALRGLGRIGGPKAIDALIAALADPDPDIIGAAATAIGIAMSLDDDVPPDPKITKALLAALEPAKTRVVDVIEAIGRAADTGAQPVLVGLLAGKPEIAAASAIALGRYGRRKIGLGDQARAALERALGHADARVRYAATYAFSREHRRADPRWYALAKPIAKLVADPDPAVRAIALAALGKRETTDTFEPQMFAALGDPDWRVAVEAVRALTHKGEYTGPRMVAMALLLWLHASEGVVPADWSRDLIAAALATNDSGADTLTAMRGVIAGWKASVEPGAVHVVLEGLAQVKSSAREQPVVKALVEMLANRAASSTKLPPMAGKWIACVAHAALDTDALVDSRCRLPDHLRLPMYGERIVKRVILDAPDKRRSSLGPLLSHADARIRAAGIKALVELWKEGDDADRRATAATVIAALGDKDPLIAGTAVEAVPDIYEADRTGSVHYQDPADPRNKRDWKAPLEAAIVARANVEKDPELGGALFDLIGKQVIASGLVACRAGLTGAPVLAKAAAKCMKALGHAVDEPAIRGATVPTFGDVRMVIGKQVTWRLATTRGEIVIELSPDTAPWAVTMIATLTRKGFYNGLEMHRVVPNFVAQGGDPTQSGWGGPGFALPAEPSSGAGFVAGGVGIADAGRDSGGSQWFVMHGAAPHLDGRYTWIGKVVSGQKSADALVIGDAVTHATIDIKDRP